MSLFDDPMVVEAAARAFAAQSTTGRGETPDYIQLIAARVPVALAAAVDALDRADLTERCRAEMHDRSRGGASAHDAEAVLVAIGLIEPRP